MTQPPAKRSRLFAAEPSPRKRKKRSARQEPPPPIDPDVSAIELRDRLKIAKQRYGMGEISEDELYAIADQYLVVVNQKQRELAIKHGQRFRRIKRADLIRDV